MKTLYFDCTNGISGDMLLKALKEIGKCRQQVEDAMSAEEFQGHRHHHHGHGHDHHHHGRSYGEVRDLIEKSGFSDKAKKTALRIYGHIAEAEAKVHEATLETVHFHEVGRDEAIKNALGIGLALEIMSPDIVLTSPICDGKGTITCSHGEIPVPVPAVQALMEKCSYAFETAEVSTEMVTPSGLAGLMGVGAKATDKTLHQFLETPSVELIGDIEIKGSRNTGRGGLKVYLLKSGEVLADAAEE